MTTRGALEVVERLAARVPAGVDLGMGTVLTAADVDRAVDAGARFVVSPSVVPAVIAAAADRGIPSATWWSATCWPSGSARWSGATTRPPL